MQFFLEYMLNSIQAFQANTEFLTQQNQYSSNDETLKIDLNCDQSETIMKYAVSLRFRLLTTSN